MSKTIPAGITTSLSNSWLFLCRNWKISRKDGTVLGFTEHDIDLVIDGVTYKARTGGTVSAVRTREGVASVDDLEIEGILSSASLNPVDFRAERYNGAKIECFIVDWRDPTGGKVIIRKGWFGDIQLKGSHYLAEVHGLMQAYSRTYGKLYSQNCRLELGDSHCLVPVSSGGVGTTTGIWMPTTGYAVGDMRRSIIPLGVVFTVSTAGTSGASEPFWNLNDGGTTDDGTVVWTTSGSGAATGSTNCVVESVDVQRRSIIAAPNAGLVTTTVLPVPKWEANDGYWPTDSVRPTVNNGFRYYTEFRGKSGGKEPNWPASEGGFVEDGDILWKAVKDEWYQFGVLFFTSGDNAGIAYEIKNYDVDLRKFILELPTFFDIEEGDTFSVEPGCNKMRSTCIYKFDNILRFEGEPFVPGLRAMLDYPDAKQVIQNE